jgi:hypothetical protein
MDSGSKMIALLVLCFVCVVLCSPMSIAASGVATALSLAASDSGSGSGSTSGSGSGSASGSGSGTSSGSIQGLPKTSESQSTISGTPKTSAGDNFTSPLPSGPSWCREPGKTEFTGYGMDQGVNDLAKCQDNCIKDSKCKAFESDGKDCWYYGGAETQQPLSAPGAKNQCYVKK